MFQSAKIALWIKEKELVTNCHQLKWIISWLQIVVDENNSYLVIIATEINCLIKGNCDKLSRLEIFDKNTEKS